MAVKWKNPMRPLNRVVYQFMTDALQQLQGNLFTQRIYPFEVYPGYEEINKVRELNGQWHSTGAGQKSFEAHILNANEAGDVTMSFSFLDYMRFVDMGVGAGTRLGNVDSKRKARFQSRYVSAWDRRSGRSQRPAVMMEMRHVQRRITEYVQDYYGYQGQAYIIENIDGLTLTL